MSQWHTQASSITTILKVRICFTLPEISAMKIITWNCHVDDSAMGIYNVILVRYLLTALGFNLELSGHFIKEDGGTLKGSTVRMLDLGTYEGKLHLDNFL